MQNHDIALTGNELRSLRCVAGMMIPASAAHGVPGADDDTIFADIVDSIGRDLALVKQASSTAAQHRDSATGNSQPGPPSSADDTSSTISR